MKFTVQSQPLSRLVEILSEGLRRDELPEPPLRMVAYGGRLCMQLKQTVAEMEAAIHEEGECSVLGQNLLGQLRACRPESKLTIQADAGGLNLGQSAIPVTDFRARPIAPLKFQVFLATDLGSVPSKFEPELGFEEPG